VQGNCREGVRVMSNKKYWIFFVIMFLVCLVLRLDIVLAQGNNKFTQPSLKGIKGLSVLIETLPKALEKPRLDEDMIRTDVELKLRLAGITVVSASEVLELPGTSSLYVCINAYKDPVGLIAFNTTVELLQGVYLKRDISILMYASTWSASAVGTVGEFNIHEIRGGIKDVVDVFINAYLSVNPKGGK
jgi:hypothetical protein